MPVVTPEEPNSKNSHTKHGGLGYYVVATLMMAMLLGGAFWLYDSHDSQIGLKAVWPDGSVITIRGVVAGTNEFAFDYGPPGIVRQILPASILHRLPSTHGITIHPSNPLGLTVCMTRQNPTNGAYLDPFWGQVETVDAAGNVFVGNPGSGSVDGNRLIDFNLESFPRREKSFRLRIHDQRNTHVAEFVIRNPFSSTNFPSWTPESLPITKTNGDVQLTLSGLTVVSNGWGNYCNVDYKVESPDSSWTSREHIYQWFTDATGNKGAYLSPNESAWKFHMQVYRPNGGEFPTNLAWTLPLLTVPNDLCVSNLQASNTVDGISIWVPAFCGGGILNISNRIHYSMTGPVGVAANLGASWSGNGSNMLERFGRAHPFVVVETGNLPGATELVIHFRDSDGHLLSSKTKQGSFGIPTNPEGRTQRRCLELTDTNVEAVSVEIVVNRAKEFEFLVKPPAP